ncbi:MAG TPA: Stp1/IreP family PP2C-type Ser/Thr phosphatase [Acidimicrobiales bacterium]|nr:Stp1/IreP family PP2C-type Ser/Thr phosphatase [Acidimicrobiales bacterium]
MTTLRAAGATDTGRVRRSNQDQVLVTDSLYAVADGMGGHNAGEVASLVAVEALRASFEAALSPTSDGDGDAATDVPSAEDLREAVRAANRAVFERSVSTEDLRGMGTTLTTVALVQADGEQRLAVANVGDSRAYVFAQGELTQLTEDHSVPEELVRQGQLDPEEVSNHPQRHILTRALGINADVEVDLWEILPFTGDRLLLCSDGLCRELTDDQISAVLRRLEDPAEVTKELVTRARASGGADNISVVLIDVVDDDDRSKVASAALASDPPVRTAAEVISDPEAEETGTPAPPSGPDEPPVAPVPVARGRRLTLRVVGFVLVLIVILGAAAGAVGVYARHTYYVGLSRNAAAGTSNAPATGTSLVIYKGRPGGLLWFQPTVAERPNVTTDDVLPSRLADLRAGKIEPTLAAAHAYLGNLVSEAASVHHPTTLPPLPATPGATTTSSVP